MSQLLTDYLLYLIVPVWLLAGLADWYCHRRGKIETNSGLRESILHILMLMEIGIPVLAALFLEINGAVFLIFIGAFILHEFTALWDVHYAQSKRVISFIEQHIHSFLELIPLFCLLLLTVLHWDQFSALIGNQPTDFSFRFKQSPLAPAYLGAVISAIVLLQAVPYGEELWRCCNRMR